MEKRQVEEINNALFKKLEELNMKIPADPPLYADQIDKYALMYRQEFDKFLADIQKKNQRFAELLIFLTKNVHYFTSKLAFLPVQVIDILKNHGPNLHPYVRKKCVGAIMILRAKNILFPVQTTKFLLSLFNIEDKQLRKIVYKYTLNDIRRMNKHHKNNKINQQIRNHIHDHLIKRGDKMAQKSLQMMIELYKRNVWTDNRSVNIIAEGCFSQSPKIRLIAAHFLMATTERLEELSESEDQGMNPSDIKFKKGITKSTKNKEKQIEKQKKKAAKKLRKKQIQTRKQNFMPIDVIYNPQEFAERLFNIMAKKNTKFNHRIILMALIGRLVWRHKLILLPFYGSLVKYLEPKQKEVHKVLTYFAESVHELVPDDQIQAIIKHICEKFVNDRCSEFAMTIGLNTIREVYVKLPYLMEQETVGYLSGYYDYKNKNVSSAAKALINMIRDVNSQLLPKKYRGRNLNEEEENVGERGPKTSIEGAELLDHKGQIPIYMDRILTDEDFKKIRKLKRKKEQEKEWKNFQILEENQQQAEEQDEEEDDEISQDEEQIDLDDCQEISQILSQQENQDLNDEQEDEQSEEEQEEFQSEEDEEGEEESELSSEYQVEDEQEYEEEDEVEDEEEEVKVKVKNEVKKSKRQKMKEKKKEKQQERQKMRKQMQVEESSSSEYESEEDPNPHGFISVDQIAFYKKSKTEIKAEKKLNKQNEPKYKHQPKEKKGGSTNRQKLKMKPLMMVRAKKNKIRKQEKQVKLKIKQLKTQLGRVRSGKEAKRLKNMKIKK